MICDAWTCLKAYTQIPGLEEAAAFLQTADTLPCGEYPLSGGNFVRIQEYETRPEEECRWEAHRSYADLQVILQGKEKIGWTPLEQAGEGQEYDPDGDIQFFKGNVKSSAVLVMERGVFALFLPQDAHRPCCADGCVSKVRKAVVKLRTGGGENL